MIKKKLIIIVIGVILGLTAFYFLYRWFQHPVSADITNELSNQSENRLDVMKESGKVSGNLSKISNPAGEVFTTSCFSIAVTLPFSAVKSTEEENGKCLLRAALTKPRGTFVVHTSYNPDLVSIQEASGVNMRLENADYTVLDNFGQDSNTIAFKSQTELSIFSIQSPILITISISELGEVDDSVQQAAKEALESLQVFTVE